MKNPSNIGQMKSPKSPSKMPTPMYKIESTMKTVNEAAACHHFLAKRADLNEYYTTLDISEARGIRKMRRADLNILLAFGFDSEIFHGLRLTIHILRRCTRADRGLYIELYISNF